MSILKNIGVLVSGGGTNLQAIIDAVENGKIKNAQIKTVVSSKAGVYALERAKKHNIQYKIIERKSFDNSKDFDMAILNHMKENKIDLIVMAGFMSIVGDLLINEYRNKIINVHPSLIPSFCGKGFYGLLVHQKALEYGVKITGATVHFVNEIPDGGAIILQKEVYIKNDDTKETLQKRVMEDAEHIILPRAIDLFCNDMLCIKNDKCYIREENIWKKEL